MSPSWSRYGIRSASVALLLAGVAGGVYLSQDREIQQQSASAQAEFDATLAEEQYIKGRHAEYMKAYAQEAESERAAAAKAAEAAKAAAKRAQVADEAASRKAEREAAEKKAKESSSSSSSSGATVPYTGPVPESCNEYSGNRKTGCALMLNAGFAIDQFPCLDKLWKKESGWNHKAQNKSSGAYGIPQALPGTKMASAGSDWRTSPATQIKWGLGYIKGRYGTPCKAWSHSQSVGWY